MSADLRTRTSLFCGALALAIAASVLLRGRAARAQLLYAAFAADVGLWYLAQWLFHIVRADVWARFTALLAVFLPQFGLRLFDAIVPEPGRRSTLQRVAGVLMAPMLVLVLSPQHRHGLVRGAVFTYTFGLLAAGLYALARRGERSRSRETQRRVRILVGIGALAALFTLADFLWFIGAPLPPVGAVLSIVFLFLLAESLMRARLVDLYDIVGQLLVSTALAFLLAGIFYVFVRVLPGSFDTMYLNAVLAAIVILVLFEPLRDKVEEYTKAALFRERVDIERAVDTARRELQHVLQVDVMADVVLAALSASRRATGAALYLRDPTSADLVLEQSFGPSAPERIDGTAAHALIERIAAQGAIVLESTHRAVLERRRGAGSEPHADERVVTAAALLGPYRDGVCVGIRAESGDLFGLLALVDDRVRDAFNDDEVKLLESLAVQVSVVIENSRVYRRLQERDRLAALGQMAAGLAHEVKNPLGAIKGAAQLLSEPHEGTTIDAGSREFVGIILEEVDRLDRVVGSVLDYARPTQGTPGAIDANGVVRRTLQLLSSERTEGCTYRTELADDLPPARADAEQLRQVLINLVRNAAQAMNGRGEVVVSTRARAARLTERGTHPAPRAQEIEIAVIDRGPGIAQEVLKNLFVPFFTTKDRGTGLGLAISQRMANDMGGRIEVVTQPGAGATFSVVLPAGGDAAVGPSPVVTAPA